MKTRNVTVAALLFLAGAGGIASAADAVPLKEATAPWLTLLRSGDTAVRTAATKALVDLVRKHPAAAGDLVHCMAAEENAAVTAEYERGLVPLAKESPATVSALIQMIRRKETNYRARNFGVKVLSQVGSAAATGEFVEALAETYCPVPGAYFRIMRALGKDAAPVLTAGFRHPNATIRNRATAALRMISRTEPAIQQLFDGLQAEPALLQKVRTGTREERIHAITALAEWGRTISGTGTLLVSALKDATDKDVLVVAEDRLIALGRESHETVAALVAGVRSKDAYRLRILGLKVLPKVGATLNCKETIEALGDKYCPVPGVMRRILLAAGPDALPVLGTALTHNEARVRTAAASILQQMPVTPQP